MAYCRFLLILGFLTVYDVIAFNAPTSSLWKDQRFRFRHRRIYDGKLEDFDLEVSEPPPGLQQVLFIETGVGSDQHGQDPTKACVRACKDAISFNSIPSISDIIPGGRGAMKLRLQLAVPYDTDGTPPCIDVDKCAAVFPYGVLLPIEIQQGGMRASSGAAVGKLGDSNDDWIIAIAAVTIGY